MDRDGDLDAIIGDDVWLNGSVPGDLDLDGEVAFPDFLVLSNNFDREVDSFREGDVDGNGRVEFGDFVILVANFREG